MVESSMAEEDYLARPIRFSPSWPPKPEPKPMPVMKPTFSLAFKKAGWPPQTDDVEIASTDSSEGGNLNHGSEATGSASGSVGGNTNPGAPRDALTSAKTSSNSTASPDGPGAATEKPKRAVKDYSSFFAKNAAPPTRPVYVLQPGQVALPEVFLGSDEPESS